MNAQENPVPREGKAKTAAASEESPIETLGRMIAGTWAIDATLEPREVGKKVGKDVGKSVIRFGPGKLALIEDYQTHGDGDGTRIALGIFWWDFSVDENCMRAALLTIPMTTPGATP